MVKVECLDGEAHIPDTLLNVIKHRESIINENAKIFQLIIYFKIYGLSYLKDNATDNEIRIVTNKYGYYFLNTYNFDYLKTFKIKNDRNGKIEVRPPSAGYKLLSTSSPVKYFIGECEINKEEITSDIKLFHIETDAEYVIFLFKRDW